MCTHAHVIIINVTLSHLRSKEITGTHKSCIPNSRATTKCKPVYMHSDVARKVVHIKHVQHFDLRLKSLIMNDHDHRSLYRYSNSRSIVGFNLKCPLNCYTSLSNRFIYYLQGLYTRRSPFKVSCTCVTNNTLSDST